MLFFKKDQFSDMLSESTGFDLGTSMTLPSYIGGDMEGMETIISESSEAEASISDSMMFLNEMSLVKLHEGVEPEQIEMLQENAVKDAFNKFITSIKEMFNKVIAWVKKNFEIAKTYFQKSDNAAKALIVMAKKNNLAEFKYKHTNWNDGSQIGVADNVYKVSLDTITSLAGSLDSEDVQAKIKESMSDSKLDKAKIKEAVQEAYMSSKDKVDGTGAPDFAKFETFVNIFVTGKAHKGAQKALKGSYGSVIKDIKTAAGKADKDSANAVAAKSLMSFARVTLAGYNQTMSACLAMEKQRASECITILRAAARFSPGKKKADDSKAEVKEEVKKEDEAK